MIMSLDVICDILPSNLIEEYIRYALVTFTKPNCSMDCREYNKIGLKEIAAYHISLKRPT